MNHIEAMKQALDALELSAPVQCGQSDALYEQELMRHRAAKSTLRQAIEQAEQDHTYGYAKGLAEAIFKQHFASDEHYASGRIVWGVNDTVIGILTQIDNMVADMVRKPQQAEQGQPAALFDWLPKDATHIGRISVSVCAGGSLAMHTHAFKYDNGVLKVYVTDNDNEYPGWCEAKDVLFHLNFPVLPLYASPQHKPLTDETARFKAQHEFLEWNRQQDEPLVKIAYEYGVFAKALELYTEAVQGIKEKHP